MSKWEKVRLGDIFKITSGGTPSKSKPEYYQNGSIQWVRTGDLKNKYIRNVDMLITEDALRNSSAKLFPVDTVLIAMYGATIGACSILTIEAATNQACAAFLPNSKVTSSFLYYFLCSIKNELIKLGVGGAQPNISGAILKNVTIPLPPLEVQKKIAQTLDAASELIALRKKQLADLDNLIKSVFYDMFGDPVTNEKGWEVKTLGLISTLKSGKFVSASEIHELSPKYKYPCFGGNGLRGYVEKYSHEGEYSLIGRQGALCGNVQLAQGQFYATEHAVVVTPVIAINTQYLFYILRTLNLNRLASGAAQPGLTVGNLNGVKIPLPPLPLQNRFATIIQKIEEQKNLVQKAIDESQYLFDSLMNEYFE